MCKRQHMEREKLAKPTSSVKDEVGHTAHKGAGASHFTIFNSTGTTDSRINWVKAH